MQYCYNLFEYNLQEGPKIKLPNINTNQSKYGISIYQIDHIMKHIIQEYWGKKTKYEVKFQQSPFPVYASFENTIFTDTPLIGEELIFLEIIWRITQALG